MKTVIITSAGSFNGKFYATFKCLFGFGSKMQELFGNSVIQTGKASATLCNGTKPNKLWKVGNVYSNVEFIPLEKFEMEMQPLYNADSELVGNIAKPTCRMEFTDESELLDTLSHQETKEIKEDTSK